MIITPKTIMNLEVDATYQNIVVGLKDTLLNIDEIKGIVIPGQTRKTVTSKIMNRIHSFIKLSKGDYMLDLNDIITYLDNVSYVNKTALPIIYKAVTGLYLPPIVMESHLLKKFVTEGFRALENDEKTFFKNNYHANSFFLRKPSFSGSSVVSLADMKMYTKIEKFTTDFDDLLTYVEGKGDIMEVSEGYFMSRKSHGAEEYIKDYVGKTIEPMIKDESRIIIDPKYSDEQKEAIRGTLTSDEKVVCLTGPAGCISGNNVVKINRNKKSYNITIRELYHKFNNIPWKGKGYRSWFNDSDTFIRSNKDGVIGLNRIISVMYKGVKETITIHTNTTNITCTHDHKILTNVGWVRADEINTSHSLAIDTHYRHKKTSTITEEHKARIKIVNRDIEIECGKYYPHARSKGGTKCYTKEQYLVYDAHTLGISIANMIDTTYHDGCKSNIDTTTHVIHHIDGVHQNNELCNLKYMTINSHKQYHSKGYRNFGYGNIEYDDVCAVDTHNTCVDVYDIECVAPYNNFVVNNVVVHNCGKTLVISSIVDNAHANGKHIVCCAFTGKAASRMEQSEVDVTKLKYPPKTIHSLMATLKFEGGMDLDLVIIDEASTMNSELFYDFIQVLQKSSTLDKIKFIFVGDSNQLPPISGGQIFEDIITLDIYPIYRLTKIFRTTDSEMLDLYSDVLSSSHKVSMGKHRKFFKTYNIQDVGSFIERLVGLLFDKDDKWYKDNKCYILTHTNKYCDYINYLCYKRLTGKSIEFYEYTFNDHPDDIELMWEPIPVFWKGAKIVFTKNDRIDVKKNGEEIRVTNGTVANVVDIVNGLVLVNSYDDGRSFYIESDYDTVKLAYAMTVYKSQGSEAQFIIYIHSNHIFETKRLAYTAMTRARKNLKIYTPTEGFLMSKDVPRFTNINSQ